MGGKEAKKGVCSEMNQLECSRAGEFRAISLRNEEARVFIR